MPNVHISISDSKGIAQMPMNGTSEPTDLGRAFCDLVMKGGITSGVVYPSAIARLAAQYRLRNIGGASAGAIAAGAAAAAEYRRQTDLAHPTVGFDRLAGLGEELGKPPAGVSSKHSRLFYLFAPTPLSRPLFSVITGMLNRRSWIARIAFGILALLRAFPGALFVGLVLWGFALMPLVAGFGAGAPSPLGSLRSPLGVLTSLLAIGAVTAFTGAIVLAFALYRSIRYFARVMHEQEFGLCTGMREPGSKEPAALTEWLYDLFQAIAGKPADAPLTFGDLRRIAFKETPGQPGIVLRVMTTCLTAGRPYTLPIEERLFFDPAELGMFFPSEVVAWMTAHPWAQRDREDAGTDALARAHTAGDKPRPLSPIPAPDDFPVIVAVRMSLSFPILLSALPLHRLSVKKDGDLWTPYLERLYFTDGGVCSNLPIHLFDSPFPAWPTFAINLRDDLPEGSPDADRVILPRRGRSYQGDRYTISRGPKLEATISFLAAIVNTMQNWRDMLQRAAPGSRERVFTVRHTKGEGGLNLDMQAPAIEAMTRSGKLVAEKIDASFRPPAETTPADDDWQYHRWVRLRVLLPVLREFLAELGSETRASGPRPSVADFLTASPPPMGRSYELNASSRAAGWALLDELGKTSLGIPPDTNFERTGPRPAGTLRVTPTF
jgi:predicted acylesterase/phospholipase RssA